MLDLIETNVGTLIALEKKVNWAEIAKKMKTGRNAKQCRDRWMNYLRPGLKKGNWTANEEELIREMYDAFGAK